MIKRLVNNGLVQANDPTPVEWDFRAEGVNPTQSMSFVGTLAAADLNDPTLTIHCELQGLRPDPENPGTNIWGLETSCDWRGGQKDRRGNSVVPSLGLTVGIEGFPLKLRAFCNMNRATRITVDVELI